MNGAIIGSGAVGMLALVVGCGGPSGLSQADFVQQANAVCARVDAQVKAIPKPSQNDLKTIAAYASDTEGAYQSYLDQVTALATKARDKTEIDLSWITPARADFAQEQPLLDQLVTAAKTGDETKIATVVRELRAVSDHTASIQAFQTKYGAVQCSSLLDDIGS